MQRAGLQPRHAGRSFGHDTESHRIKTGHAIATKARALFISRIGLIAIKTAKLGMAARHKFHQAEWPGANRAKLLAFIILVF